MAQNRFDRYRQLSAQLGTRPARELIDRLQVLALTQPDALHEFETFINRGTLPPLGGSVPGTADRRRNPDRRKTSMVPLEERRRGPRRASERAVSMDPSGSASEACRARGPG
jgi:hypothetical protein